MQMSFKVYFKTKKYKVKINFLRLNEATKNRLVQNKSFNKKAINI